MNQKSRNFRRTRLIALTAATAVSAVMAHAADDFRVVAGFGHRVDADIDEGGRFTETRVSVSGSRAFTLNDRLELEPILTYRFSTYDFSGASSWDDIHMPRATLLARYSLNERWRLFGGPSVALAGESGADFGDALTVGGAFGVSYSYSEQLTVGGGFTASTEIEDSARIRPIVLLNWQMNDRWSAEGGYTEVAGGGGPGGEIRYKINNEWSVGAGVQYNEKRFRLSDSSSIPNGVGEDRAFPIYAKVSWITCPNATLELIGGVAAGGELRIENKDGHEISDEDYDPAALFGFRAVISF
jgi:hypothetical protein